MDEKVWYIWIDKKTEGPYSVFQLKRDYRFTPETWVWREGMNEWLKAGEVEELRPLFEVPLPPKPEEESLKSSPLPLEDEVMALKAPRPNIFWIIILIILIILLLHYL